MNKKSTTKTLTAAIGVAMVGSLAGIGLANAAENPFGVKSLDSGYMQLAEGKCGGEKKEEASGKCGGEKKEEASGKCGGEKKEEASGKCGGGKCGGEKKEEASGKCGGGK